MPAKKNLVERLSKRDPNLDVAKRFSLKLDADSLGFEADVHAGVATIQDAVNACVATFTNAAQAQAEFRGDPTLACKELDMLKRKSILHVRKAFSQESERLGEAEVREAIHQFSRRVEECAARTKQKILEAELARMGPGQVQGDDATLYKKSDNPPSAQDENASRDSGGSGFARGHSQLNREETLDTNLRKETPVEHPDFPLQQYAREQLAGTLQSLQRTIGVRTPVLDLSNTLLRTLRARRMSLRGNGRTRRGDRGMSQSTFMPF